MNINHVTVLVRDNRKALNFYCDKLGLERYVVDNHCMAKVGDVYIHLAANSGLPTDNSFQHFCIAVDGLEKYIENIKEKGVEVREEGLQYFINDLDGNLIELMDTSNKYLNP